MGKAELLIDEDITKYKGNWIAVYNKKVIAYGNNLKEVHENASKLYSSDQFFLHKIPENSYPFLFNFSSGLLKTRNLFSTPREVSQFRSGLEKSTKEAFKRIDRNKRETLAESMSLILEGYRHNLFLI
ncbi:MAG: DUF5678 domain-containing protein [archaeon]